MMATTGWKPITLGDAAGAGFDQVLAQLVVVPVSGLSDAEVSQRRAIAGSNALDGHVTNPWTVLLRQLRNPLLMLLLAAAAVSLATSDRTDALIIFAIVVLSVGLGFVNEYRSEKAVAALHSAIRHRTLVMRNGHSQKVDVVDLVPGDIVSLGVGDVVPADLRLIESSELECDEAVLTGESMPVIKTTVAMAKPVGSASADSAPTCCALMGTVVRSGAGRGVVVGTGAMTEFGRIAARLGNHQTATAFQQGLAEFSRLLVKVAGVLCVAIFVINAVFKHSLLEALLFSLAIAIGITPQLLPAIVTISLSTGARQLARRRVIVKRLVTIEDLGNIQVLFTDKTGTLTEGHIRFLGGVGGDGKPAPTLLRSGILCNEAVIENGEVVSGNALDIALWDAATVGGVERNDVQQLATVPFDHERRLASVLVKEGAVVQMITKGAPEDVLKRCVSLPDAAQPALDKLFAQGARVVAVATKPLSGRADLHVADEVGLTLAGFLTFADPPKADAQASLQRLADLGILVKVITGDNAIVAAKVCDDLGLPSGQTLDGAQLTAMTDDQLRAAIPVTRVFARVSPEQKSQIIKVQRGLGSDVAFLGDGVNDAVALHDADVGISVEGASEVATDAADIVLLAKDLGVLADGVVEGRRIFANTMKYVLMATSSNFGNMFSAAGASMFLSFLPMLPGQILLNNLLYDFSQITIPTDNVDEEQLRRPSSWDIHFIRRFMGAFGPISSVFDFATFGIMLWVMHAGHNEFRSGWFMESLCTQTLVIFVIRTRRIPFWRSAPSRALLVSTLVCAVVGIVLPFSPLAGVLGFTSLPAEWLGILAAMMVGYLAVCEVGKWLFYRIPPREATPIADARSHGERLVHRRRSHFAAH